MSSGQLIRDRRIALGLSIYDLAHRADVDFTYISKIERDKVPPPSERLCRRIAAALDVDAGMLVDKMRASPRYKALEAARWYISECCPPRDEDDRRPWMEILETIDAALEDRRV